jgi:hypothetical protein
VTNKSAVGIFAGSIFIAGDLLSLFSRKCSTSKLLIKDQNVKVCGATEV